MNLNVVQLSSCNFVRLSIWGSNFIRFVAIVWPAIGSSGEILNQENNKFVCNFIDSATLLLRHCGLSVCSRSCEFRINPDMRGICVKCFPFYLFINSLQHDSCVFKLMLVSGFSVECVSLPFSYLLGCATVILIGLPAVMCVFQSNENVCSLLTVQVHYNHVQRIHNPLRSIHMRPSKLKKRNKFQDSKWWMVHTTFFSPDKLCFASFDFKTFIY